MSQTFTISTPDVTTGMQVAIVLIVAAVLSAVVIEVYRRHYSAKQVKKFGDAAEKLGKTWTAVLLAAVASVFTGLGYLLVLAPHYTDYFSSLPFVGKHFTAVVGVAYLAYNIRLQKWFQQAAAVASKWSGGVNPVTSTPLVTEPQPEAAADPNALT